MDRKGISGVGSLLGTRFGGSGRLGIGGELAAEERDEVARRRRIGEAVTAVGEQAFERRHFFGFEVSVSLREWDWGFSQGFFPFPLFF